MLRLHGERVSDILLSETEEPTAVIEMARPEGDLAIELRDVSFRYADGDP